MKKVIFRICGGGSFRAGSGSVYSADSLGLISVENEDDIKELREVVATGGVREISDAEVVEKTSGKSVAPEHSGDDSVKSAASAADIMEKVIANSAQKDAGKKK